jgi:hypothetical protein
MSTTPPQKKGSSLPSFLFPNYVFCVVSQELSCSHLALFNGVQKIVTLVIVIFFHSKIGKPHHGYQTLPTLNM